MHVCWSHNYGIIPCGNDGMTFTKLINVFVELEVISVVWRFTPQAAWWVFGHLFRQTCLHAIFVQSWWTSSPFPTVVGLYTFVDFWKMSTVFISTRSEWKVKTSDICLSQTSLIFICFGPYYGCVLLMGNLQFRCVLPNIPKTLCKHRTHSYSVGARRDTCVTGICVMCSSVLKPRLEGFRHRQGS